MKKSMISLLVFAMLLSLVSVSFASQPIKLIYSTNATPGDAHDFGALEFKIVLEELSGGTMTVEYHNQGVLYKQDAELAAVKSGAVDIVYLSAPWLAQNSPWVSMFGAGYIFKNFEQMDSIMNGEIGQKVFTRIAEEQGVLPLSAYYLGTRQLNLIADKEIKTPADLKGINLRMPTSESWIKLGQAMGANPTPVAFSELYLALQTNTVDGQENPLPTVIKAKFYEVTKSITLTNHLVDSVWPTINLQTWNSLTDEQKGWVKEATEAGRAKTNELNLQTEAEAVEFLKNEGMKVYEADVDAFQKAVSEAYLADTEFTKDWDMELFAEINK
ncbi:MAG: sialic acid TRAP transporter substrate-binding protein SiaP [Eubacteriales bacterium]|nr:sialic acid TRAP transporter substrate-binding protein SiaP [Eubacteriales bacterium]